MRRASVALICSGVLALSACGRAPESAPVTTATADAIVQRVRGNGVMGKDGYGISLCGESSQRIVDFGLEAAAVLDTFLKGGAREFFIDGWGNPGTGGRLAISRIERIYTEGPGCDEPLSGVAFIARGNEPFWSVRSGQDGVSLERPGIAAVTGPFAGVIDTESGHRIETETAAGKLIVQLTPGPCSDGMSDAIYGWTAKASLRNEEWSGCAFAGLPAGQD